MRSDMSWQQWHRQQDEFIKHTCQRWDLPLCDASELHTDEGPVTKLRRTCGEAKEKLVFRETVPATDELLDTAAGQVEWSQRRRCFIYITDCKSLQGILCGTYVCTDPQYEPLLTRVLNRFVDHFRCKWHPPQKWKDPVRWMPRAFNKVADGLTDHTMDRRSSWQHRYATTQTLAEANIIIQTDGGLREEDCAAAGWIIGLWSVESELFEPFEVGGVFLENSCTVFMADALAIDEASAIVQRLLRDIR